MFTLVIITISIQRLFLHSRNAIYVSVLLILSLPNSFGMETAIIIIIIITIVHPIPKTITIIITITITIAILYPIPKKTAAVIPMAVPTARLIILLIAERPKGRDILLL